MNDSYRSLRATLAAIGTSYFAYGMLYFLLTGVLLVRYFPTENNEGSEISEGSEKLFSLDNTK